MLILFSYKNLIPQGGVDDEAGDKDVQLPIHDPNQKQDTMVHVLGMRFSNWYKV